MLLHHARLKQRLLDPGHEFTIEEAREAVNQPNEPGRIDTRDAFHKTFFPLLLIAEHVANRMTKIVFTGKYRRYDGEIVFEDERRQKVELTVATDGHQEAIRMELKAKNGRAPPVQHIKYGGKKNSRIFHDDKNVLEAIYLSITR